jgi:hypothetical protein
LIEEVSMAEEKWLVRAVKEVDGFNAVWQSTRLIPGMRGWMLRAKAEAAARAGTVEMLSPGGLDVLRTTPAPAPVQAAKKGRGSAPAAATD